MDSALKYINHTARCYLLYRGQQIKFPDLCVSQYAYIEHACLHPGNTQDMFSKDICVDKSTVAHQLRQLEKAGYITRKPSADDGRCRLVYPTQKALDILPQLRKVSEEFSREVQSGLTGEECNLLNSITEKVFQNAMRLLLNPVREDVQK